MKAFIFLLEHLERNISRSAVANAQRHNAAVTILAGMNGHQTRTLIETKMLDDRMEAVAVLQGSLMSSLQIAW